MEFKIVLMNHYEPNKKKKTYVDHNRDVALSKYWLYYYLKVY